VADSATCSVVRAVVYTCTMVPWHVMLTGFNRRIQSFENRCLCSGASCQGLMRLPVACKPLTASATRLSVLRQWPECYRFGMLTYRILAVIHLYKKKVPRPTPFRCVLTSSGSLPCLCPCRDNFHHSCCYMIRSVFVSCLASCHGLHGVKKTRRLKHTTNLRRSDRLYQYISSTYNFFLLAL
jgi:hypothetical protein